MRATGRCSRETSAPKRLTSTTLTSRTGVTRATGAIVMAVSTKIYESGESTPNARSLPHCARSVGSSSARRRHAAIVKSGISSAVHPTMNATGESCHSRSA